MFHLLSQELQDQRIEGIPIRLPSTLIVASDEFDRFLRENRIDPATFASMDDGSIRRRFFEGRLSETVRRDLKEYVDRIHVPLAVRSSSLLEDSHYQPSAGLYATYMLPNNHPDPAVRLDQLCGAIQMVYASACLERPRKYHQSIGMSPAEEKMAIVIQEVAGKAHGDAFYPTFSGVAQSHNFYPIFDMKSEDGVATVALGLGKQVVEGGDAVRFCPRYPRVLPQFNSPASVLKASQRDFYAIDLSRSTADLAQGSEATLVKHPLSRAEEDGALSVIGGAVSADEDRVFDGVNRRGARVVTFGRILNGDAFPLCGILDRLLAIGRESLGSALEIEFAVNLDGDGGGEFHFLQMRPLVALRERCDISLESLPRERVFCRSRRVMGNGRVEGVRDILYIHPERFDRSRSAEVAGTVSELNDRLLREGRHYVLIGPGRWGSMDPWIGIPVVWHQISRARVIVEVPALDIPMDPSQGTHFFHNMTSAGIGYFSLSEMGDEDYVRWDLLEDLPGEAVKPWLRHVRLQAPIVIRMDGQTQHGVLCLP